jgi:hypothetical protein
MFWKAVTGVLRTSIAFQRSASAIGAAIVVSLAVYDLIKARRKKR